MRIILEKILVCGVLFSFLALGFQVTAANAEPPAATVHAIVFYDKSGIVKPMLARFPQVSVIDEYGTFAHVRTTDGQVSALRNNNAVVQTLAGIGKIKFPEVSFDTSQGEPQMPQEFRAMEPIAGDYGYYVVQVTGPPKSSWVDEIGQSGEVKDLTNYYAYIVKMTPEAKNRLAQKSYISWIGLYHPFYRLRGGIELLNGNIEMKVVFFKDANFAKSVKALENMGGRVTYIFTASDWWDYANVQIDSCRLAQVASMPGVWFVEPVSRDALDELVPGKTIALPPSGDAPLNNRACWVIQSGISGQTPVWDQGLHGEGIIVGSADTGIDYDHAMFTNAAGDHGTPGPAHRKIVRYWTQVDDWDSAWNASSKGHGTHTTCSIIGNNISYPGQYSPYDGMAYNAKIAFADIGNTVGIYPGDITIYFQDAVDYGATSHSDSWGTPGVNSYDSQAQSMDQYLWDHPGFLAVKSAGNSGPSNNTVSAPGTSKNGVTIGAAENGGGEGVWVSSSRGPTAEGVRKPDLVAPGMNITSAKSDGLKDTYNSAFIEHSGTSCATPITAGGAILVEQYFKEGFYPSGQKNAVDGFAPSGSLRKAVLINSGRDLANADAHVPDNSQGWGMVTLDYSLYFKGDPRNLWIHDEYGKGPGLSTGETWTQKMNVKSSQDLKFTLVWNDYPGSGLKNDLNLIVTSPTGTKYVGSNYANGESAPGAGAQPDSINPVECVLVKAPENGAYTIDVTAVSVSLGGKQNFTVVVTGDLGLYGIALNAPKAGMTMVGGTTYGINWTATGGTPPVSVEIQWSSNGGSSYTTLASSQPASGEWQWSVPSIDTTTARVKVIATDAGSNVTQAESGNFNITTAAVHEEIYTPVAAACCLMLLVAPMAIARRKMKYQ